MGSIPVRSTKKRRMQNCIRCFLVLLLVNPSSVRQYGEAVFLPRVSRLRETANSRIYQQKQSLQNCIRRFLVLLLVNPSSVRQYGKAVFLPRVSRSRETLNLFPWSSVFSYAKRSLYSRAGVLRLVPTPFSFLLRAK